MMKLVSRSLVLACSLALASSLAGACDAPPSGDGDGDGDGDGRPYDGRIPGCLDDEGIDLLVVEGDEALSLSWNNHTGRSAEHGYVLLIGTGPLETAVLEEGDGLACTIDVCEETVSGLDNDKLYSVGVGLLDEGGAVVERSCTVAATPHELIFGEAQALTDNVTPHRSIALAGGIIGVPLFAAVEGEGGVELLVSLDLGDSWEALQGAPSLDGASAPAVAFVDPLSTEDSTGYLALAWVDGGVVRAAVGSFELDLLEPAASFPDEPVDLGSGAAPALAAARGFAAAAWEGEGGIRVARTGAEITFEDSATVSSGAGSQPSVAIDDEEGRVYVGYHGAREGADADALLVSASLSGDFGGEVRVDDDPGGDNQQSVNVAADRRTGVVSATWEDRRGGANVRFARSTDFGASFSSSVDVSASAGLTGDQVAPRAIVDPGRNTYVLFIDSSDGQRPVFLRFNGEGGFEDPLYPSSTAGSMGVTAQAPAVFGDAYGTVYAAWTETGGGGQASARFSRAE